MARIILNRTFRGVHVRTFSGLSQSELFISPEESSRFMVDCMKAVETPENHAKRLAENLLAADVRGHFSHGLSRLSHYIKGT